MEISESLLTEIEKAASIGFDVRETAMLVGLIPSEFELLFADESHPVVLSYNKGLYQAECSLRSAMMTSALSGSTPAQVMMNGILNKTKSKLKLLNK
jgi:hypothetical protein